MERTTKEVRDFTQATKKPAQVIAPGSIQLSDGTKAVLARLQSPVQLHFHAIYNPESVSDNVREAADRAAALLAEVARQSAGKIDLTCVTNWSVASANAAAISLGSSAKARSSNDSAFSASPVLP